MQLQSSTDTLKKWVASDFLSNETKANLAKAKVLLVPQRGYLGETGWFFPSGTEVLLSYFRANNQGGSIDICIEDSNYREVDLRSDTIWLPEFVLVALVAPTFVGLLVEYLKHRLGSKFDSSTVKTTITITDEDKGRSVKLSYNGKASEFDKIVGETLRLVNDSESFDILEKTIDVEYEERIERLKNRQ